MGEGTPDYTNYAFEELLARAGGGGVIMNARVVAAMASMACIGDGHDHRISGASLDGALLSGRYWAVGDPGAVGDAARFCHEIGLASAVRRLNPT